VRHVIAQPEFSDLQPFGPGPTGPLGVATFATTASGTIDFRVDWTFASNNIDLALTAACAEDATIGGSDCPYLVTSNTTNKPETLTYANAPAGTYALVLQNNGTTPESGTIEIGLTTTSTLRVFTEALGGETLPASGIRLQDGS